MRNAGIHPNPSMRIFCSNNNERKECRHVSRSLKSKIAIVTGGSRGRGAAQY